MTSPYLAILIPSRGRPQNIRRLWDQWIANSEANVEEHAQLVVLLDDDDPTVPEYLEIEGPIFKVDQRNGFAPRLNDEAVKIAFETGVEAVGSWTDKHLPRTRYWAIELNNALYDLGSGFVHANDLAHGPALATGCCMTTDLIRAIGYFTPPGIEHLFVDNVWGDWGHALDRITYLPDTIIEHMHPAYPLLNEAGEQIGQKGEWDDLMREGNSEAAYERDGGAYWHYHVTQFVADVEKMRAVLKPRND